MRVFGRIPGFGQGMIMFRQYGPFVTIITASGGPGLSPCDVDAWLLQRRPCCEVRVEDQGLWPKGGRRPVPLRATQRERQRFCTARGWHQDEEQGMK